MSFRHRIQKEIRRRTVHLSNSFSARIAGRPTLRKQAQRALKTLGAGVGYGIFVEPSLIETTQITIPIPDLPEQLDGYRIAHLSDIHYNIAAGREFLRRVVYKTQSLDPDMVALTGDFVTHKASNLTRCLSLLSDLNAPDGCWAVRGNHDYVTPLSEMRMICRDSGIRLLENEHRVIRPLRWRGNLYDGDQKHSSVSMVLAGVGDLWEGHCNPGAALEGAPRDLTTVMLAHNPQTANLLTQSHRVDIQLSGHTHGGQIRPLGKSMKLFADGSGHYMAGLVAAENFPVYISRGVGTSALRFRWNCRPEIALIKLVKA